MVVRGLWWVASLGLGRSWSIITPALSGSIFLGVVRRILGCWRGRKVWSLALTLFCVRHISLAELSF